MSEVAGSQGCGPAAFFVSGEAVLRLFAQDSDPRGRRRWLRRVIGGTALGLAGVAAARLLTPPEPALLAGLSGDGRRVGATLDRRLAERFPPGTPEPVLQGALAADGFTIHPAAHRAEWRRSGYPCVTVAEVRWTAAGGRIVRATGALGRLCP
jgi:hypothetical protein